MFGAGNKGRLQNVLPAAGDVCLSAFFRFTKRTTAMPGLGTETFSNDYNPYYGGSSYGGESTGPELAGWDPWVSQIIGAEHIPLRLDDDLAWRADGRPEDDHDHIVWRYDL
jgi:hypothetical protein